MDGDVHRALAVCLPHVTPRHPSAFRTCMTNDRHAVERGEPAATQRMRQSVTGHETFS